MTLTFTKKKTNMYEFTSPANQGAGDIKVLMCTNDPQSHLNLYIGAEEGCYQLTPEAAVLMRDALLEMYPLKVAGSTSAAPPSIRLGYVVIDSSGDLRGSYDDQMDASLRASNITVSDDSLDYANVYRKVIEVTKKATYTTEVKVL